jgi:hypothetical protein
MNMFNPSKLTTKYAAPATQFRPVEGRKYTLTHSDASGQLFLTIGVHYDYLAINPQSRDEVLAEWVPQKGEFALIGRVYISGGEYDEKYAMVRYMIFQKELNLALKAIVYGDQANNESVKNIGEKYHVKNKTVLQKRYFTDFLSLVHYVNSESNVIMSNNTNSYQSKEEIIQSKKISLLDLPILEVKIVNPELVLLMKQIKQNRKDILNMRRQLSQLKNY